MTLKQKKILIIEDNPFLRQDIVETLKMENYITIEATDGEDGFKKAIKILPDLILSDILMPKIDGVKLIKKIKNNPATVDIPFIFLSALSYNEYVRKSMCLGADDYLIKPINIDDLIKTIDLKLKKREKIDNSFENLRLNIIHSFPHELRTPLNSILGFSTLLMNNQYSYEKTKEFAKYININGYRLLEIFNQYLIISKLILLKTDTKKLMLLNLQTTLNIQNIIEKTVNEQKTRYNYKENIKIDGESYKIIIKENHLGIIIKELVSNAIKFNNGKEGISIIYKKENKKLNLIVENVGNGISSKQIEEINTFMQFDRKDQEKQGLGIGLSIVKLIAEIYDLDINIESEKGMYFKISVKFNIVK